MPNNEFHEESPLSILLKKLDKIYRSDFSMGIIDQMSASFNNELEVKEYVYNSLLNCIARRIVLSASHFYSENPSNSINLISIYLHDVMRFDTKISSTLATLAYECARISKMKINETTRSRKVSLAKRGKFKCYLSGFDISYKNSTSMPDNTSLDHILPQSLGGCSTDSNLELSFNEYNIEKSQHINKYDYQYEYFGSSTIPKLSKKDKIAIYLRSNLSCYRCGSKIQQVGTVKIFNEDKKDPVNHFFNLIPVCQQCEGDIT